MLQLHFFVWLADERFRFGQNLFLKLRINNIRDPIDSVSNSVVDTGLASLSTRVSSWDNSNQIPSSCFLKHQRSTRITLKVQKCFLMNIIVIIIWNIGAYFHMTEIQFITGQSLGRNVGEGGKSISLLWGRRAIDSALGGNAFQSPLTTPLNHTLPH